MTHEGRGDRSARGEEEQAQNQGRGVKGMKKTEGAREREPTHQGRGIQKGGASNRGSQQQDAGGAETKRGRRRG